MSVGIEMNVPTFRFSGSGLPAGEAFEAWRQIMARMFDIDRAPVADGPPSGGVSSFLVGDIIANRSVFNAQRLTRERRRIEATPDHLVLQLYGSGGFSGEIGGEPYKVSRGQIAICDLRRPLDVQAVTSDTIGLSIPRRLLDGVDLASLPPRLDPSRERLLAARMTMLHRRLPALVLPDIPAVTADLVAGLRRLLDLSTTTDVLDARELDGDLLILAEQVIGGTLAAPDLSPATIAERLQVSRATLYRVFAPLGGVMERVWTMRLEAVRAALEQPAEPRNLTRLATDHGFKTAAHLSHSFRASYGSAPRDWRAQRAATAREDWRAGSARLNAWWHDLGR